MDRLRSFFDDLGLFDEEQQNTTDSDKSSIDTKCKNIEEGAGVVGDTETTRAVAPSNIQRSNRRRMSSSRSPSQRRVNSHTSPSIRKITNSMVEEEDDDDDDDDDDVDDVRIKNNYTNEKVHGLKKGEARSFTRFRYRSRSNNETSSSPSPQHRKEEDDNVFQNDDCDDDVTSPANVFGYACGVEFCTSMEIMNKIQGNNGGNDDPDNDDDNDDDDSILEQGKCQRNIAADETSSPPMQKKRSLLWGNRTATGKEKSAVTTKRNETNVVTATKTVTTEAIGDSSGTSSSTISVTKTHLRRWGHGKIWTMTALLFAWTGCVSAVVARRSIDFVTLRQPLIITELYEPIYHMGMIRVQICTNTSTAATSAASVTETYDGMMNVTTPSTTSEWMASPTCTITRFTREEVNDRLYNISRSLLTMGSYLGIALTLVLTTSIVWETINLRPIALGYLVAYFFQSFSMLFFDTDLCREYDCQISTGGYLSITASICWILTLISVIRMDLFKLQSIRLRRREERKAKREARRQERKALALRKRQKQEQLMIIDNFQKNNTMSVDMLDIEAVLTSEAEYQTAVVANDKKIMAL